MNPLLVVIPLHKGDIELAKRLLGWIGELNGEFRCGHSALLVADITVPVDTCKELSALAKKTFRQVDSMVVSVKDEDWRAPNTMFYSTARWIQSNYKLPWLWLEPDCTPLRPGWLEELAEEYAMIPRKYMGAFVESNKEGLPAVHMTGCAIYPADAFTVMARHSDNKASAAWDIASATDICVNQRGQNTKLIQSYYGNKELAPTFVGHKEAGKEYPVNTGDISFIRDDAALFHRCKDGSLIMVLRELRQKLEPSPVPIVPPDFELRPGVEPEKAETVAICPDSTTDTTVVSPPKNKGGRPRKHSLPQPGPQPQVSS